MALNPDIANLNLEAEAYKVCIEEGWTVEEVDEEVRRYRAFLQAIRDYPGIPLAPSKRVDTVWHAALLDSAKYESDCKRLFGRLIYHYPYTGLKNDIEAEEQRLCFEKTEKIIDVILST